MSTLICRSSKVPDLEFYDDDLATIRVPTLYFATLQLDMGVNVFYQGMHIAHRELKPLLNFDQTKENVLLTANMSNGEVVSISRPAIGFCQAIMDGVVENKNATIQDIPYWKETVADLREKITERWFSSASQVIADARLPGFGYIKAAGHTISTFEGITFIMPAIESNKGMSVIASDCIISTDLSQLSDLSGEFYCYDKKMEFEIDPGSSWTAKDGLSDYDLPIAGLTMGYSEAPPNPAPKESFVSIEDFIADREQYLSTIDVKKESESNLFDGLFEF